MAPGKKSWLRASCEEAQGECSGSHCWADKERKTLELDSEGEDYMEPESMAARDVTLLEQVDADMAELKCGEDGDDGQDMKWEDIMAAQKLWIRKREICAKLPLIPFQAKYTHNYQYQNKEEETESTRAVKEQMALEESEFAVYRSSSEFSCFGSFETITTLSPMYYTHWTPERIPFMIGIATTGSSLQIYSFKIQMKGENLNWPLYVYGVVAARDKVDRNRNLLFYRPRHDCQILTEDDQILRLTGPSRAIIALDPVDFEVELKLKGITESKDRPLMNKRYHYWGVCSTDSVSIKLENCKCTAEISLKHHPETVQATVLGVRIVEGSLFPFKYGGRVVCYSPPEERLLMGSKGTIDDVMDLSKEILLLDSRDFDDGVEMPMGSDGYFDLSRRVVSVPWKESMKIVIQAYSESLAKSEGKKRCLEPEDIAAKGHVKFRSKYCNISQGTCDLGDCKVEVTVAWSAIVTRKSNVSLIC
ncbi:uncharacterized protein [Lolium perenne]|uniref:uncharacterized protein n=1 Tax=Lolium perenne TaxID=4522 RepID=UPI0021F69734|nr:uncharacterized protein LOC127348725 [Lolium perenne]